MARIRTIKPEFFTSEDIVSLSPLARLLYIALWCEADREGRLAWKPKTFRMRYLPADECSIEELCDEIVKAGLVSLYGDGFAVIPKFGLHQHLNPREAASTLPSPDASLTRAPRVSTRESDPEKPRVPHASARVQTPCKHASVTRREEGKGKEGDMDASPFGAGPNAPPPIATLPLNDSSEHPVTGSMVAEWTASFPAVDVTQQLRQMRAWLQANPSRRKTRRGIQAFIVSWLSREQDKGGPHRGAGQRPTPDDPFAGAH